MRVRPLQPGDDDAVRAIFRATLVLGHALDVPLRGLHRYERLCLDWYLGPGRGDAAVVVDDGDRVCGYALVCADPGAHHRWTTRAAVRFAAGAVLGIGVGRYRGAARRFYRLRLRDGWELWRGAPPLPRLGHAHFNLLPEVRAGAAGRMLGDHIDARICAAGLPGWFGEINAFEGRRAKALERLGGSVVHRAPNHTLTALAHRPVERLTVVRTLDAA